MFFTKSKLWQFIFKNANILFVFGIGLGGGGAELLTLSIVHVCRKGGKKKDARTGIVGACLVGIFFLVILTCMIFMPWDSN